MQRHRELGPRIRGVLTAAQVTATPPMGAAKRSSGYLQCPHDLHVPESVGNECAGVRKVFLPQRQVARSLFDGIEQPCASLQCIVHKRHFGGRANPTTKQQTVMLSRGCDSSSWHRGSKAAYLVAEVEPLVDLIRRLRPRFEALCNVHHIRAFCDDSGPAAGRAKGRAARGARQCARPLPGQRAENRILGMLQSSATAQWAGARTA